MEPIMPRKAKHRAASRRTDWFAEAVRAHHHGKTRQAAQPMSALWRARTKEEDAESLRVCRDTVRNLVRAHGVPKQCRVELARLGQVGSGATSFEDAPHGFEQPVIYLDKQVWVSCDPRIAQDVYSGVGLHEAGHVLHTRRFFVRVAGGMTPAQRFWENLFEDARVEQLGRQESPGFSSYLDIAIEELLVKRELGKAAAHWEELPDLDRVRALICAFVRCPWLIAAEDCMRNWRAVNGERIFDTLREMFPTAPQSELDVERYAAAAEALCQRLEKLYAKEPDEPPKDPKGSVSPGDDEPRNEQSAPQKTPQQSDTKDSKGPKDPNPSDPKETKEREETPGHGGRGGSDKEPDAGPGPSAEERLRRQREAELEDREFEEQHGSDACPGMAERPGPAKGSAAERLAILLFDEADRKAPREDGSCPEMEAESRREEALAVREGRRFGLPEMHRMMDRFSTIRKPLDREEAAALDRAERERVTESECWQWDGSRKTIIRHPVPDKLHRDKFDAAKALVRGHVAAMRSVFRLRLGQRNWRERERTSGRIDRRMLGRAAITNRVFYRSHTRSQPGISLCLLLDESGSMGSCRDASRVSASNKAAVALQVGVLVVESLRTVPGVELEVYSHTSCGPNDNDCLVRYLFGKNNPAPASIGGYGDGDMNYDHQAILTASRLFQENTSNENRIMLVISDGCPNGTRYKGRRAIKATRDAVDSVRRKGIQLLAVAIEDYHSEEIYGARHVVHFTELGQLVADMRKLVTRIIRSSSGC